METSPRAPAGTSSNASPTTISGGDQAEPREIGVNLIERGVAEGEAVDADEALSLVPEHRRDEARSVEDADLDVRLVSLETGGGEVEQREVVLPREVLHVVGDRLKSPVARVLRLRKVLEEPRKLGEESIGVHYRWLVTPARSGSSDGGSYHERA